MNRLKIVGVIFQAALFTATASAQTLLPPFPRNDDALNQQRQSRQAWRQANTLEAFDKVGVHDAKWNDAARAALNCYCQAGINRCRWSVDQQRLQGMRHLRDAKAAGCSDPLILFLLARTAESTPQAEGSDKLEAKDLHSLCVLLAESHYPPLWRMEAELMAADALGEQIRIGAIPAEQAKKGLAHFDRALQWGAILVNEKYPQARLDVYDALRASYRHVKQLPMTEPAWREKIIAAFPMSPQGQALRHLFSGRNHIDDGWKLRGTGMINTVQRDNYQNFQTHLKQAESDLEQAWKLDAGIATIAVDMLWTSIGRGHDQETLERWFQRALAADGDNYQACDAKFQYLQPKWYGSIEEALAFGQQCAATRNWNSDIPLVMLAARDLQANFYPASDPGRKYLVYLDPETWSDVSTVLKAYEARYPDSTGLRSFALSWADLCGNRREAERQSRLLHGKIRRDVITDANRYRELRSQYGAP
jgi:hypothetical protein